MNWTQQILVSVLSSVVIGVMLIICLYSSASAAVAEGRREYRVHGAWYIFSAAGGLFLVGIFALASTMAVPEDRTSALGCSAASAVFFVFFALFMRSLRVIVDDERVTARNMFAEQSVPLSDIDRVAIVSFVVEVRRKEDPATKKRPRPLVFLAVFRGLQELLATIRARAGLPTTEP